MIKKELFLTLLSVGLVVTFFVVSFLVWLSRGKNAYLIKKKLAIGASMISMTGVATGTGCVSCYDPYFPEDWRDVDTEPDTILLEDTEVRIETPLIRGSIQNRESDVFSFRLTDDAGVERQHGAIEALDGSFDSAEETFELAIDNELAPGEYQLFLYTFGADEIDASSGYWAARFTIAIGL